MGMGAKRDEGGIRTVGAWLRRLFDARVRELGSEGSDARILNLSDTGFMAESGEEFEVGARIWLLLPGRDRAAAVIRWTAGNRLGAEFAEPVEAGAIAS